MCTHSILESMTEVTANSGHAGVVTEVIANSAHAGVITVVIANSGHELYATNTTWKRTSLCLINGKCRKKKADVNADMQQKKTQCDLQNLPCKRCKRVTVHSKISHVAAKPSL